MKRCEIKAYIGKQQDGKNQEGKEEHKNIRGMEMAQGRKRWRDKGSLWIMMVVTPLQVVGDSKMSGEEPPLEVNKHPR